ncbi:MAG: hypothetical protein HY558_04260 [Euryarchaeota archaeon]|nr:hypothetical protein [Euryarchaeota archaeon]
MPLTPEILVSLGSSLVAVASVLLYATIFRHPYELRKARAFLGFKEYERIILGMALALMLATAVLVTALVTSPGVLDVPDFFTYLPIQVFLAGGFLFTYRLGRKSGK